MAQVTPWHAVGKRRASGLVYGRNPQTPDRMLEELADLATTGPGQEPPWPRSCGSRPRCPEWGFMFWLPLPATGAASAKRVLTAASPGAAPPNGLERRQPAPPHQTGLERRQPGRRFGRAPAGAGLVGLPPAGAATTKRV